MDKVVCYTEYLPPGEEQELSFWEIFLDERWAEGTFDCPNAVYAKIGNINKRLESKQNYEFLLRAAQYFKVKAVGVKKDIGCVQKSEKYDMKETQRRQWESYRTDCYIVGKYQQEAQKRGYFNSIIATLLSEAASQPNPKAAENLLEKMISHSQDYYTIDDDTCPFLIYRGADTCYNVLNLFMDELIDALHWCRQRVEVFDMDKEENQALTRYIGQRFKAVIGIQSSLFLILMQDKVTYLHDLIIGPKYNIMLDHPEWLQELMLCGPQNYFFLMHDRNYIDYVEKYYSGVAECIYFPCAGTLP